MKATVLPEAMSAVPVVDATTLRTVPAATPKSLATWPATETVVAAADDTLLSTSTVDPPTASTDETTTLPATRAAPATTTPDAPAAFEAACDASDRAPGPFAQTGSDTAVISVAAIAIVNVTLIRFTFLEKMNRVSATC